jgi:hypothetical protein
VPEVSSFREVLEQLFLDSGLDGVLHAGATGLGVECECCLIELESAMMLVKTPQDPDVLIASPEMKKIREVASRALEHMPDCN